MQKLLFKNIEFLLGAWYVAPALQRGKAMRNFPVLRNAWLAIEDGKIADFGLMTDWPGISDWSNLEVIDAAGRAVLPCWCDSHTHIVYTGTREDEFDARLRGMTYQEIAEKGGGILNSARKLAMVDEEQVFTEAKSRLEEMILQGTGAVEIKSGYGLSLVSELKILRVIQRLKQEMPIPVKATFLAAHAFPVEYKDNHQGYVDWVAGEMMQKVCGENLADFVDVFCEAGYFTTSHTRQILESAGVFGLQGKIHVNQFNSMGGIAVAAACGALTVDHLEELTEDDLTILQNNPGLLPVALPGCSHFLGIPYTPARTIIDSDLALALASDYNPGSSPSGNMNMVVSLASVKMKLLPEEAFAAATINGAYAMKLNEEAGSITPGKRANIILTKEIPSPAFLCYAFGSNHIHQVYINGIPYSS